MNLNLFEQKVRSLNLKVFVIYFISLIIFGVLSIVANFVIKDQVATQVASLIRRMVKMNDSREIVYTLGSANLRHFDAVVYTDVEGNRIFSIPASIEPQQLRSDITINALTYSYLPVSIYADENQFHKMGTILFVYNRFAYFPIAFIAWLILGFISIPAISTYKRKMSLAFDEQIETQKALFKAALAKKARHDIRSPLAALQTFVGKTELSLIDQKHLSLTINHIQDIISDLEDKKDVPTESNVADSFITEDLVALINEVVDEKKLFLDDNCKIMFVIETEKKAFAKVLRSDLKRSISNIIDNAIQATGKSGTVKVFVDTMGSKHSILVQDSGCGINSEIMEKIGTKGFTFGKVGGSGLGLYYAFETAKLHKGKLRIHSKEGSGTTVTLEVPSTSEPSWYVDQLQFQKGSTIGLLDDQPISFYTWETILQPWITDGSLKLKLFSSPQEFKMWILSQPKEPYFSLVDYDLGKDIETGLYLISLLNLQKKSILVTGHFDHPQVQQGCSDIGCKLLAKGRFPEISVS